MAVHNDLGWISQRDLRDWFSKDYLEYLYIRNRIYRVRDWKERMKNTFGSPFTASFLIPREGGYLWNRFIKKAWVLEKEADEITCNKIRRYIETLILKKNKPRFLSKYPRHSVNIGFLHKVFPDALFIILIRDGRAVVQSLINRAKGKNHYFGIPLKNNNQNDFDILERHARQWIEVNEEIQNAKQFLKSDQYFELKYEDFLEDPKNSLKKIFRFCELEEYDVFIKPIKTMRGDKIEYIKETSIKNRTTWDKKFSENEKRRLNEMMKNLLERFEYH